MQDAHRIWVGLAIAIIVAGVLAMSEISEREELPWFEPEFDEPPPLGSDAPETDSLWDADATPIPGAGDESLIDIPLAGSAPQEFEERPAALSAFEQPGERARALALEATPEELAGSLEIDSQGHFRPTPGARERFDSFFADSSLTIGRGRLNLHLLDELPARAADEAMAVVDRYAALLEAEAVLRRKGELDAERQAALRSEVLGSELAADLFGVY